MAVIEMGNAAVDGTKDWNLYDQTTVSVLNPADGTGTITSVELYINNDAVGVAIIIFEEISLNHFTARCHQDIGDRAIGYHEVEVDLEVVEGDLIGIYGSGEAGRIECLDQARDVKYRAGDQTECVDAVFLVYGFDRTLSLYGTGTTEVAVKKKNVIFMGANF